MTFDRSLDQRMDALAHANEIRTYRAKLKRDVAAGRRPLAALVMSPPEKALTMKIWNLLLAVPGVGRGKADRALRKARVSPSKTLGGLTARQRRDLLTALAPSAYQLAKQAAQMREAA